MTEERKVHRMEDCESCQKKDAKWFKELLPHMLHSIEVVIEDWQCLLYEEEIETIRKFISSINEDQLCVFINLIIPVCEDYIMFTLLKKNIKEIEYSDISDIIQEGINDTSLN